MTIIPQTIKAARKWAADNHRHSGAIVGALFACGLRSGDELVGVAIAGRPVAPEFQKDPTIIEINRVCTDGSKNACSALYGAIRRAGRALGYRRFVTYTTVDEPGTSLRAAGFWSVAEIKGRDWDTGNKRNRWLPGLYQPASMRSDRVRWEWP